MPVYPGDIVPSLQPVEQDGIMDHKLITGMHVGTHMDAPLHMIPGGKKISEVLTDKFVGPGKLIDARERQEIDANLLAEVRPGDIVLVLTGWGAKFRDADYYETYPVLTESFAKKLVELQVKVVGLDTSSPDKEPYAIHKILLGAEILIIENLTNLESLVGQNFEVIALPAKLDTDAAPTRVIAKVV